MMVWIMEKIDDLLDSKELSKWIKEHIDILEKSWDVESLKKIADLIRDIFNKKEIESLDKQDSTWDVISDLFRDKNN